MFNFRRPNSFGVGANCLLKVVQDLLEFSILSTLVRLRRGRISDRERERERERGREERERERESKKSESNLQ